jgi:hypothetical protein
MFDGSLQLNDTAALTIYLIAYLRMCHKGKFGNEAESATLL